MTHAPECGAAMPPTEGRDTLKERLALLFNEPVMHLSAMTFGEAFGDQVPDWMRAYGGRVDAILAEIEREHVLVPVDRWERVERAAGQWLVQAMEDDLDGSRAENYAAAGLRIGDLPGFDLTATAGDGEAGA